MTTLEKIIIVENDTAYARTLRDGLKAAFPKVLVVFDPTALSGEIESFAPDFLVVDNAILPGPGAAAFCREVRALTDAPLLLFCAKARDIDKARALDAGADDFMDKPLDLRELISRMQAIWRRYVASPLAGQKSLPQKYVEYPGLSISLSNYTVVYGGRIVEMPPRELELLYFLASNPNHVFTREQLLDRIWGYDFVGDARTVDVHIKRIRKKITDHNAWSVDTVWGVGYKFSTSSNYTSSDDPLSAVGQTGSV